MEDTQKQSTRNLNATRQSSELGRNVRPEYSIFIQRKMKHSNETSGLSRDSFVVRHFPSIVEFRVS